MNELWWVALVACGLFAIGMAYWWYYNPDSPKGKGGEPKRGSDGRYSE